MLGVRDPEYLAEVRKFADSRGIRAKLEAQIEYLDTYAEHGERGRTRCLLFKDFAPHSFYFVMEVRKGAAPLAPPADSGEDPYARWFSGGCIFFEPGDTGVGTPQLSVSLSRATGQAQETDWEIHT